MALLPRLHRWTFLSLLSSLLFFSGPSKAIWPFPNKRFSANAFVDAQGLGLEDAGRIVAFGDFNGDQFLDVVTINDDQNMISIYTWSHELFSFFKNSTLQSPGLSPIINVIPADFTHNGKLDILLMTAPARKTNQLDMFLYVGSVTGGFEPSPVSIPASTLSQPIPMDFDGDLQLDMIGHTQEDNGSLTLWNNVWEQTNGSILFDPIRSNLPTPPGGCTLSNPHSSAILDFDGDCLADLFLVCDSSSGPTYQIYLNDQDGGFKLGPTGTLPKGAGMVSFADMNRDGTIDLVFPVCSSVDMNGVGHDCSINIAYNKQRPFCTSTSVGSEKQRTCRRPDDLCTADPNFDFDLSPDSKTFISIPISDLLHFPSAPPSTSSILMFDNSYHPPLPLPLKLGDADLDGFPEILFIAVNSVGERIPKLAWSLACSNAGEPGCFASNDASIHKRGYAVATGGEVAVLETFRDARSVSFLDMDEDGTLDILVQRTGGGITGQKINFIQNNVFHDAFFMKAIVLNGACGGMCVSKNPADPKYHPFGVSYSGATYKYTILDTTGKRSAAQISQLPQTSYHALQTPYSFFGLGRTNNYIENLFVGTTRKLPAESARRMQERRALNVSSNLQRYVQSDPEASIEEKDNKGASIWYLSSSGEGIHYISMEGVIPNSKLVIIPPNSPLAGARDWKQELYLRPGEWIPWVTVTLVVATTILGIIVWIFHWNEKREDELERRRALHSINFDAL